MPRIEISSTGAGGVSVSSASPAKVEPVADDKAGKVVPEPQGAGSVQTYKGMKPRAD